MQVASLLQTQLLLVVLAAKVAREVVHLLGCAGGHKFRIFLQSVHLLGLRRSHHPIGCLQPNIVAVVSEIIHVQLLLELLRREAIVDLARLRKRVHGGCLVVLRVLKLHVLATLRISVVHQLLSLVEGHGRFIVL